LISLEQQKEKKGCGFIIVLVFRLLVSAGGKYLNAYVVQSCHENEEDEWKIIIPALDCSQVGPLFIEVSHQLTQC